MRSTVRRKTKPRLTAKALEKTSEAHLLKALNADPKEVKVPISVRLDGDIYLELKRLAKEGYGSGRYQTYLTQILRHFLFGEAIEVAPRSKRQVG